MSPAHSLHCIHEDWTAGKRLKFQIWVSPLFMWWRHVLQAVVSSAVDESELLSYEAASKEPGRD